MARGRGWEFGSKYSTLRYPFPVWRTGHIAGLPVQSLVRFCHSFLLLPLTLLCVAGLLTTSCCAQDDIHVVPRETKKATASVPPPNVDPSLKTYTKPLRKDVDLVLVPVTITDPMNRLVTGLEKENFALTDNGQPQVIRHFSSEDAPISLGVIFDISGSMSDKIDKSRQAVVEFFRTANPQDEFFLITCSEKPELLVDYTSSIEDIQDKLVYAIPKGRTALLDAIYLGMDRMRKAHYERKALLIISM